MAKPAAISLVLCESIYRDLTGKTALVGLFNEIRGRRFPLTYGRLSIYASVTEAFPDTRFKIDVVNAETEKPVIELQGPPPSKTTPLTVCDFNFEVRQLVFPEPGLYFVRFWGNQHLLLQRPFRLVKIEDSSTPRES